MHRTLGILLSVSLLAACGPRGTYVSAKVERVERKCEYTETMTTTKASGSTSKSKTRRMLDCSDDPGFSRIKHGDSMRLKGTGTAIVRYTSPLDKQEHQAWVKLNASDRSFYELDTGQTIKVRIDPNDASVGYL